MELLITAGRRLLGIAALLLVAVASHAITPLSDADLGAISGQALIGTTKFVGDGTATNGSSGLTFYTMGLDANLALNTNIQNLQLGCGGINGSVGGANGCDIDINNMSLSGNPSSAGCASALRVECDAVLKDPYIQLAITGDGTPFRQVVGFRLSAAQMTGLMTFGTQNSTSPNGINNISGYMVAQSDSSGKIYGTASTQAGFYDAAAYPITGKMNAFVFGLQVATAYFHTSGGGFSIPAISGVNFSTAGPAVINGSRISSITLSPTATLPNIYLGWNPDDTDCGFFGNSACNTYGVASGSFPNGPGSYPAVYDSTNNRVLAQGGNLQATVDSCTGACLTITSGTVFSHVHFYGVASPVSTVLSLNESLGFIHQIVINSPFYLSFQKQNLQWPGVATADTAQRGWWLSIADPVNLGLASPSSPIDLCADASHCIYPAIQSAVSSYLNSNPPGTSNLGSLLSNGVLGIQAGTFPLSNLPFPLGSLQLAGQSFQPNCYGTYKFC